MSQTREEMGRSASAQTEPDRLAGFPAPRETFHQYGQEQAEAELLEALRSGRMHHAWLLAGPEGVGKATLAYRVARAAISGGDIVEGDAVDRQVAGLAHPNLLVLRRPWDEKGKRYRQEITVEEARRLRVFLGNTSGRKGWRVVVVDRADELNQSAANALLKLLEEPPPLTLFLLIAGAEGRLPVTVRSRCRTLRLGPLNDAALRIAAGEALRRANIEIDSDRLETALVLAQGSVRRVLELATGDGIKLYGEIVDRFGEVPALDSKRTHRLAAGLKGGDSQQIELFFSLLLDLIERLVRHGATGRGAIGREADLAKRLFRPDNLADWAELWETIARAQAEALALNLDREILVLETFFRLERFARQQAI
jgi:DNA polymerase III subunit delta'